MDAVKLLALLGAGLWMIPVLWPVDATETSAQVSMSEALFYIFGVWLFLILLSALLVTRLRRSSPSDDPEERHEE